MTGPLPNLLAHHAWLAIPVLFSGGVLMSFTPCLYPMIPITLAVVGGSARTGTIPVSRGRVAALTLAYVGGLAVAYATVGLIAGMSGAIFGGISTHPAGSFVLAHLLVVFALMMLDVVPVPVPHRLIARAATLDSGGRVIGAAVMGTASGLVAAPCGAPVLATVLAWVTTSRSAILGFVYLFVFSLGMCALLIVVGVGAGSVARLPKPGPWMVWTKRAFAVLTFASAEYYLIHMGGLLP